MRWGRVPNAAASSALPAKDTCQPGLTVAEFLEISPDFAGPVFERVHEYLVEVDDQFDDGTLITPPPT